MTATELANYIEILRGEFQLEGSEKIAREQKAYMRNQFAYFGMRAEERRVVQKPFLIKAYLPPKSDLHQIVQGLWIQEERDFVHFAMELAFKYNKRWEKKDIQLFEFMVVHKSWWDSIDYIATKLMGSYFKKFQEQRADSVQKWLDSGNFWLQRCALLFQLKYKEEIDTELLSHAIKYLLGSKEFFINKAIGWVLREYSKTNPTWVVAFVEDNEDALNNLSKSEALRLLKR